MIQRRDGTSFREFALFVHDFAFLFDKDGKPLNLPAVPGSHDDPGDELMIRLIDGDHEEQHVFNVTGMSWQKEVVDEKSPLAASQTLGVSEAFNLNVKEPYQAGDYLYYFGGADDVWLGLWGIVRAYDKYQECLKPLCKGKEMILPLPPCPGKDDMVRRYEVAAVQTELIYNRYGDHDPNHPIPYFDYPRVPLDLKHKPSSRVSLNPQFLQYDPICDSGINAGYNNKEQTVGIGESKRYLWKADREYGACILQSFGDMWNHRYHGLFGAVIVEPAGAEWYENFTKRKNPFAEQAVKNRLTRKTQEKRDTITDLNDLQIGLRETNGCGRCSAAECMEIRQHLYGRHTPEIV